MKVTTEYEAPSVTETDEPLVPPKGIGERPEAPQPELTPTEAMIVTVDQLIAEASENFHDSKPVSSDSLIQHSIAASLLSLVLLARTSFVEDHADDTISRWDNRDD